MNLNMKLTMNLLGMNMNVLQVRVYECYTPLVTIAVITLQQKYSASQVHFQTHQPELRVKIYQ